MVLSDSGIALLTILLFCSQVHAELTILSQISGGLENVGLGFDHTTGNVWVYSAFLPSITNYLRTG